MPKLLARQTFDEHSPRVVATGFGARETQTIILVLENGALRIWDFGRDEIFSLSGAPLFRKPGPISCAAFGPHGVATGHECGQVRLHALDGRKAQNAASHLGRVLTLIFTPTQLYSGGNDGAIMVTSLNEKYDSRVLLDGLGAMTTFALSPDEKLLAIGGDDGAIGLWRLEAGETPRLDWTRRSGAAPIRSLHFSPNGNMLISRSANRNLGLWAAQTSFELPLASSAQCGHVAPAFSADSRVLAVAHAPKGVALFDIAMEKLLCEIPPLGESVRNLAFSPDASAALLLVAGAREIAVWEVEF